MAGRETDAIYIPISLKNTFSLFHYSSLSLSHFLGFVAVGSTIVKPVTRRLILDFFGGGIGFGLCDFCFDGISTVNFLSTKTMKSSSSTLNPFAQSYVPIALREASSENKDSSVCAEHGFQKLTITDDSKLNGQKDDNPLSTHYNQVANMKFAGEEFEMDLAYLQMSFPGMSDQSLMDVYTLNDCDLEASLEMLSQLESVETSDCLPDALDIGDVPEAAPCGECSTTKTKNVVGESCSSYGSSNLAVQS